MAVLPAIGRMIAGYLNQPSRAPHASIPTDLDAMQASIRAGDVLLVEGRQRVSVAIKYLTQSTWSHAALCVEQADSARGKPARFVEADAVEGVRIVEAAEFEGLHTRICRPVGLDNGEISAVTAFALSHVGDGYDLANVIDLARYLFPTPPVPGMWKRRMIALGSGEPTRAICSTLVAQAFQSIRYPILPEITQELLADPGCAGCVRDILHIRHHSLFTPRDFDVSPYFRIIKPSLENGFDPHRLNWDEEEHARPAIADG